MEVNRIIAIIVVTVFVFVFAVLPWIVAFRRPEGEAKYKLLCHCYQGTGMVSMLVVLFVPLLFLLGERSDLIGVAALAAVCLCSFTLGPYLGTKFFILSVKNKIGKVGAEQIVRRS